ncbi:MAG TPA: flagellar motor protein MotB [Elusimicrobiota bacterium]|nr:flagellar motor protein MotB [Elusimicrobiota bacterium]
MGDPSPKNWSQKAAKLFQNAPDLTNVWLTVYSDMMTNLMLFFLCMFSLNLLGEDYVKKAEKAFRDKIAGKEVVENVTVDDATLKSMSNYFENLKSLQKEVQIIQQGEGIRIRLPEPVLFDIGRADLKPEAGAVLNEIANGLKHIKNTIVIEGHTDDVPLSPENPYKSNWELSSARAENVVNYFISIVGLPPERLAVAAYGEYWPFAPNDSPINKALNRRIEMLLIVDDKKDL